jgi:hypothetical protein
VRLNISIVQSSVVSTCCVPSVLLSDYIPIKVAILSIIDMANEKWMWLLVVVGGPCLIALILMLICLFRHHRARYLGVLPPHQYSFPASAIILSSPKSQSPSSCGDPDRSAFRIDDDDSTPRDFDDSLSTNKFIFPSKPTSLE